MPDKYVPNKLDYRTFLISDRLKIVVNFWDGQASIRELAGDQKVLLTLTPTELATLTWVLEEVNIKEV